LVWAKKQTAGRGQFERKWLSENGGLYFSVLLEPDFKFLQPKVLVQSFANHFISYCLNNYGIKLWLKEPNDVYYEDKKLVGILTENSFLGNSLEYCIMGIGINVNQKFSEKTMDFSAVSLSELTGEEFVLEKLLESILQDWEPLEESVG
jgi:BirA family biotin operon repressor/biotin-[acetyl-CoA-carboxylase] ligase